MNEGEHVAVNRFIVAVDTHGNLGLQGLRGRVESHRDLLARICLNPKVAHPVPPQG